MRGSGKDGASRRWERWVGIRHFQGLAQDCRPASRPRAHKAWLPDEWGQGVKQTQPTSRSTGGGGGILTCYVAPDGKSFFHKETSQLYAGARDGCVVLDADLSRGLDRAAAPSALVCDGLGPLHTSLSLTHIPIARPSSGLPGFCLRICPDSRKRLVRE